jgi:membrane associated rhomboid family serine protease
MEANSNPPSKSPINILPGTGSLIGLCVVVHLGVYFFGDDFQRTLEFAAFSPKVLHLSLQGYILPYPVLSWLSPVTYGFLHGGWGHLGMNMAFLLAFGSGLERQMGAGRLWLFFLILTLASTLGSVAHYLLTDSASFMVGASGAVSGFLGAILRLRPHGGPAALAVYVGINIVIATFGGSIGGDMANVAWEAHVAGALAGYILLPIMFKRSIFTRHQ